MPAGMVMGVLEHPGTDRVRQSKPTVFYGGSSSGGLGGCSLAGGNHSEREAQEQRQQTPQSTRGVTAGLGQGSNPGWNLLLDFPWSEAVSKANLASAIRDNGRQQKKYQA